MLPLSDAELDQLEKETLEIAQSIAEVIRGKSVITVNSAMGIVLAGMLEHTGVTAQSLLALGDLFRTGGAALLDGVVVPNSPKPEPISKDAN